MKVNIIRYFMTKGVELYVVPWDYDFTAEEYDGLFISNGPGNPQECAITISHIKQVLEKEIPVFGICLGNQLLALAAGCSTYKVRAPRRRRRRRRHRAAPRRLVSLGAFARLLGRWPLARLLHC
eukprot:7046241-Prymnesium_polylepis.1